MKKSFLLTAVLFLGEGHLCRGHADGSQATVSPAIVGKSCGDSLRGLYAGISGGAEFVAGQESMTIDGVAGIAGTLEAEKRTRHSKNGLVTLHMGYQCPQGHFFWAVEGIASLTNNQNTSYPLWPEMRSHYQKTFSLGVHAHLGMKFDRFKPYLVLGVEASRFSYLYDFKSNDGLEAFRKKNTLIRPVLVLGGGVQMPLTSKLAARLDYGFRIQQGIQNNFEDNDASLIRMKISPIKSHTISAGLSYFFSK